MRWESVRESRTLKLSDEAPVGGLWPVGFSARVRRAVFLPNRPWRSCRHLDQIRLLRTNDLFDGAVSRFRYPDVAHSRVDPVTPYAVVEALEDDEAGPRSDRRFNGDRYPDVARAGLNPLAHDLRQGGAEGRSPNPLFEGPVDLDRFAGQRWLDQTWGARADELLRVLAE